jgi:hypothetical protein
VRRVPSPWEVPFAAVRNNGAACRLALVSPAIDGIIKEADEVAGEVADKSVLDAALINAAQAAEHYEIARYGGLVAWAKQLGRNDCASVLQKTLDEENGDRQEIDGAGAEQGQSPRRKLILRKASLLETKRARTSVGAMFCLVSIPG